jgi:uncharacterized Zn finger protein
MVHKASVNDKYKCPSCGSNHVDGIKKGKSLEMHCLDCGSEWLR